MGFVKQYYDECGNLYKVRPGGQDGTVYKYTTEGGGTTVQFIDHIQPQFNELRNEIEALKKRVKELEERE